MRLPLSIAENLRFLLVEVDSQLARLAIYLTTPEQHAARGLLERAGYPENLKQRIHAKCLDHLARCPDGCPEALTLRSVEFVATELNHITALCRDCVEQTDAIQNRRIHRAKDFARMLKRVRAGIAHIEPSLRDNDTHRALKIARAEDQLDKDYRKQRQTTVRALKRKKSTEDLIQVLLIAQDIRRMGDALLAISEAIISTNVGQAVDLDRYQSINDSAEKLGHHHDQQKLQFKPIAETRSGSVIAGVSNEDHADDGFIAIFKDGIKRKVKEEREGVENWHQIYPGLAPRILSYQTHGQSAALLIEHLPGFTLEQILLNETAALSGQSLQALKHTLHDVWEETRTDKPINADFTGQLRSRINEVYKIHPEFKQSDSVVCGYPVVSFDTLVEKARHVEKHLSAPFRVYIHGDFNLDNVIYDPTEKRINFIDLHRSRYMDYVQDVSVFMVSNYRLRVFDKPRRQRALEAAQTLCQFARDYAATHQDASFELRLALGLARSFATSARFILDKSLAREMFLRARYLLEQVIAADHRKPAQFTTDIKEIFIA